LYWFTRRRDALFGHNVPANAFSRTRAASLIRNDGTLVDTFFDFPGSFIKPNEKRPKTRLFVSYLYGVRIFFTNSKTEYKYVSLLSKSIHDWNSKTRPYGNRLSDDVIRSSGAFWSRIVFEFRKSLRKNRVRKSRIQRSLLFSFVALLAPFSEQHRSRIDNGDQPAIVTYRLTHRPHGLAGRFDPVDRRTAVEGRWRTKRKTR